jgi:spoIIIJ-associated protein
MNLTPEEKQIVIDMTQDLLKMLGVTAEVSVGEDTEEIVEIMLQTDDGGMLIGYHGETLDAFQTLLPLLFAKKIGRFIRVSLEVGDYRKNRTEYLINLALNTKEKVLAEGREFILSDLKPWERRIVHTELADDPEVLSESMGEGKERVLVIKKRD